MSFKSNLSKAAGLGLVVATLAAGSAFAAVATSSVNVRSGPGTGYHVLDQLAPGEYVSITGRSGGWCEVARPGPNGWVSCSYLGSGGDNRYNRYRDDDGPNVTFSFGVGPYHPYPAYRPFVRPYRWWW